MKQRDSLIYGLASRPFFIHTETRKEAADQEGTGLEAREDETATETRIETESIERFVIATASVCQYTNFITIYCALIVFCSHCRETIEIIVTVIEAMIVTKTGEQSLSLSLC